MFKNISLFLIIMFSISFARVNYFNKVVDGELLKKGQFDMIGTGEYKTAKAPLEDNLGKEFDNYDGSYSKATTTSLEFNLFYALTNDLNLRFGLPIVGYNQIGWDKDANDGNGEYVKVKTMGIGGMTVGGKYNLKPLFKTLPSQIKMAVYFDLLFGMLGNNEVSTGDVDYNMGVGFNYKNFVVNTGLRYNTGKFTKDAGQLKANANYNLLSTDHQSILGTKKMVENEDGAELDGDGDILPKLSVITYLNLGYVQQYSKTLGFFGEFDWTFDRGEIFAGLHWAPSDMRQMFLKPYFGIGINKYSDQLVIGADLILREGIFAEEKTKNRNIDYYTPGVVESTKEIKDNKKVVAPVKQEEVVKQRVDIYKIIVTSKYANIRSLPKSSGKVMTTARKGDMFSLISEVGNYYNIELLGGRKGFMHKSVAMKMKTNKVSSINASKQRQKTLNANNQQIENNKARQMLEQQKLADKIRKEEELKKEQEKQRRLEEDKKIEEQRLVKEKQKREKIEAEKKVKIKKLNKKWKNFKIDDSGDVDDAKEKVDEGVTAATYALANALGHEDDDVRNKSYEALVTLGAVSVPAVGGKLKAKRYFIKKQAVLILKEIGDPSSVKYLERALGDKSINKDAEDALKSIPGKESHEALMRYMQQQKMASQIDNIKKKEEAKDRSLFAKHGLTYGDTKNNILTMAQKIAGYKKNPSKDPKAIALYNEQYMVFQKVVKKYNDALGPQAAKDLLSGYGYNDSIFTK